MADRGQEAGAAALALGALLGFPIGILSGFSGVGGGEYRTPVLLGLLRHVRVAIAANLAVGAVVSAATFLLRAGYRLPADQLLLGLALITASLPGGYAGAALTGRLASRKIKALLAAILVATALRLLLFEVGSGTGFVLTPSSLLLALPFGFALGLISGLLGLAAGEYRIPVLILVFDFSARAAGTVSSLAAIPQQVVAYWKHRRMGHATPPAKQLGLAMGLASMAGVALGVFALGRSTDLLVLRVLGAAMLVAAARVLWEARRPEPAGGPGVPGEAPG